MSYLSSNPHFLEVESFKPVNFLSIGILFIINIIIIDTVTDTVMISGMLINGLIFRLKYP